MKFRIRGPVAYFTCAAAVLILLGTASRWLSSPTDQSPEQSLSYHPHLLREAARRGIWPGMGAGEPGESNRHFSVRTQATYAISYIINPYFQHGDFDHDGKCDLAIVVTERSSGRHGFAIIPATLDEVHLAAIGPSLASEHEWKFSGWKVEFHQAYSQKGRERLLVFMESGSVSAIEGAGSGFGTYLVTEHVDDNREPDLVQKAQEQGLWPEGIRYEILWETNPAYMRGDFNGDGEFDVAVLVRDTSNREKGIVIIHNTLDGLHTIFPSTESGTGGGITNPTRILIIPKGEVLTPFSESGAKAPIILNTDAIWAGWPGAPYTGAWYFKDGRYVWVTLSD